MNKEDYRLARANAIGLIAAFEFSDFIEKQKGKDYDTLIELMVAVYDAGFIYATSKLPEDHTITFEFPNMNNKNNKEV